MFTLEACDITCLKKNDSQAYYIRHLKSNRTEMFPLRTAACTSLNPYGIWCCSRVWRSLQIFTHWLQESVTRFHPIRGAWYGDDLYRIFTSQYNTFWAYFNWKKLPLLNTTYIFIIELLTHYIFFWSCNLGLMPVRSVKKTRENMSAWTALNFPITGLSTLGRKASTWLLVFCSHTSSYPLHPYIHGRRRVMLDN